MNFEEFGRVFLTTQAIAISNRFVLQEVVMILARQTPAPDAFVERMFERVIAHNEQGVQGRQPSALDLEINYSTESFFSGIRSATAPTKSSGGPPPQ